MSRTSITHPLRIAEVSVGQCGGAIGITFAPGKWQPVAMTGAWERDLDLDLAAVRSWGATYLLTLLEPQEFEELRIRDLPQRAVSHGLTWCGLPITDGAAPDDRLLVPWRDLSPRFVADIQGGARLVVHCKGGLGRAGTVAAMLLLDAGVVSNAEAAMALVRTERRGAIETAAQEAFLRDWAEARYGDKSA